MLLTASKDFQSSATEVAIVIGATFCGTPGTCLPASEVIGNPLYNGPYNPQFVNGAENKPPHQNFTVTIPDYSSISSGFLQLNVLHVSLIGVGLIVLSVFAG